jgi:hypothetical protein
MAIVLAVSITLNVCQAVVFWLVMLGGYAKEQKGGTDHEATNM